MGFEPTERVQAAQTISSRSRYDHFDTPPYSVFDVLSEKGENYTRELVIFRKRALRFLPVTTGIFSGQPSSKAMAFRVFLVSNIYGKPFVPRTHSGNEKPRQRLGFSGAYFLMHHSGSGDVTRTHDTPGMNRML